MRSARGGDADQAGRAPKNMHACVGAAGSWAARGRDAPVLVAVFEVDFHGGHLAPALCFRHLRGVFLVWDAVKRRGEARRGDGLDLVGEVEGDGRSGGAACPQPAVQ